MGRPKKNLPRNWREAIAPAVEAGATLADVAHVLDVSVDTVRRWRDEAPEFREALAEGKRVEEKALVNRLHEIAMSDASTAAASAMFLLKTRHGYREGGPAEGEAPRLSITFQMPAALDPLDYARVVNAAPESPQDARLPSRIGE